MQKKKFFSMISHSFLFSIFHQRKTHLKIFVKRTQNRLNHDRVVLPALFVFIHTYSKRCYSLSSPRRESILSTISRSSYLEDRQHSNKSALFFLLLCWISQISFFLLFLPEFSLALMRTHT